MKDQVRVVVVDDSADTAEALALALGMDGYSVRTAHNGLEALQVIGQYSPHCVVLDVEMPGMDGCELSRRLRSEYGDDIVLIAMSGRDSKDARVAETFERVDHYLCKPLDLARLQKVLRPVT